MTQPTGVFVRLPLSDAARELLVDAAAFGKPDDSHDQAILSIGTPVTGGKLKPFLPNSAGPLVKLSDAQAAIAALEAEVGRLRAGLARIEQQANEYPGDDAAALGWIVSECDALKGPEA